MMKKYILALLSIALSYAICFATNEIVILQGPDGLIYECNPTTGTAKCIYVLSNDFQIARPKTIDDFNRDTFAWPPAEEATDRFPNISSIWIGPMEGYRVTTIDDIVFYQYSGLSFVNVGKNVERIGTRAFYNSSLMTITFNGSNPLELGENVFQSCKRLHSVNNLNAKSIPRCTFDNCINLSSIKLGDALKTIDDWAFASCTNLKKINIPVNTTYVGESAFEYSALTELNYDAIRCNFADASLPETITKINFGGRVESIPNNPFRNLINLEEIVLGYSLEEIKGGAFEKSKELKKITCYSMIPPSIGTTTFSNETKVNGILYVPESSIEAYRSADYWKEFKDIQPASSICDLYLDNNDDNSRIYEGETISLEVGSEIKLSAQTPGQLLLPYDYKIYDTSIATISDDGVLKGISGGETTLQVGYKSQAWLFNVKVSQSATEPEEPEPHDNVSIKFQDFNWGNATSVDGKLIAKNDVEIVFSKGIGSTDPKYYTTGQAVRMYGGNNMNISSPFEIASVEFEYASGYGFNSMTYTTASPVKVDSGTYNETNSKGEWTFSNTTGNLTNLGTKGHARIVGLKITFKNSTGERPEEPTEPLSNEFTSGYYTYKIIDNNKKTCAVYSIADEKAFTQTIDAYGNSGYKIKIPDSVKYNDITYKIISIADDSKFYMYDDKLSKIEINNNITKIGKRAFRECYSLQEIENLDHESYSEYAEVEIDNEAFYDCQSFTKLKYIKIKSIGSKAFYNSGIAMLEHIKNIDYIGEYAFDSCFRLSNINLSEVESLTIGDYAFRNCEALKTVTLGDGILSLGKGVFSDCKSLSEIMLPNNLISINEEMFKNCTNLSSVNIPFFVKSIGESAFENCAINKLILSTQLEQISSKAFKNNPFTDVVLGQKVSVIGDDAFVPANTIKKKINLYAVCPQPPTIVNNTFGNTSLWSLYTSAKNSNNYLQSKTNWALFNNPIIYEEPNTWKLSSEYISLKPGELAKLSLDFNLNDSSTLTGGHPLMNVWIDYSNPNVVYWDFDKNVVKMLSNNENEPCEILLHSYFTEEPLICKINYPLGSLDQINEQEYPYTNIPNSLYYDINGRYVGNSEEILIPGIYIKISQRKVEKIIIR